MDKPATRKLRSYPTDVTDQEWEFCVTYLTLMKEEAPQREHALRAIFNALRWMVRAGCPWRLLPNDLPPWTAVHQQTLRWIRAGCFEAMAHDLRMVLRELSGRASQPTAVILDGRTVAVHARKRSPRRLRRPQTPQRFQGAYRGGCLGAFAGLESHPGQRWRSARKSASWRHRCKPSPASTSSSAMPIKATRAWSRPPRRRAPASI